MILFCSDLAQTDDAAGLSPVVIQEALDHHVRGRTEGARVQVMKVG